jgi:hypothetical protein
MEVWGDDLRMMVWLMRRFTEAAFFMKAGEGSLKLQRLRAGTARVIRAEGLPDKTWAAE